MATAMKSVIAAAVLAFYFVPVEMTPRYKLCADNKCNSPISQVRALDNYDHQDPAFISFKKDNVITIYGKEETDNPQGLWFGESSEKPGKRGFFVQSAVREETIFNRKPSVKVRIHIQDTGEDTQPPDSPGRRQTPDSKHHGLGMSQPEIPDSTTDVLTEGNNDAVTQTAATFTETDTNTEHDKIPTPDLQSASDIITQSASDVIAQSAGDVITQSESDTSVLRNSDTDTTNDSELNTQSASELDTLSADEPNTQSLSDTQTESDSEQRDSDADIRSDSELNTQSASELNTQSASEPNTQSLSDTHTQSESDATIHYSTDIPTYDESNEVNQHQEVVSDSELNPQVVFSEEYTLVLEPVPHSETETNPQEIDVVSSKLDLQTTEEDIHDGNTLVHEVPHVEPEPETHLEVDANSEMLTDTGTNMDSVETDDSDSDNSLGVSHGKIPNTETDSESTTDAGSRANAHLNEIHSDTDAEPSSQITDDSVQDSEQWQTSDDPENIHDLTGNLERNIYSAKNSHTNLVAPNETNTIEENDLQPKNGQPTVSESFLQHHVSTEGTQIEANAIRPQTDLPTEVGTAGDAHQYKTALEIDSTEPEEEHGKLHFEESSKSETTSNMPDERQSDYTNNVELVEETLPVQPQVAAVTENDYQERVSQSRDDRGDDIPLDEQSSLDLSDVEMIENDVEREVTAPEEENESGLSDDEINENDEERDVTAPEEENEAPLSDEMKKLMNHKIVRRKGPRHDIIDEEDEENFLSGVFSAREHHIMHWERNKEEEDSEETKKLKEKKHRKGEKIDHEGSGMERAEAIQPLGSNNYSPRKVEIDMQLIERQIITDSIPVEEKERVQSRKLRKTRVNIEYDLRQHRDEMRGEYLDEEEEELEEEEEESNEKLHPGRNEYGRTVMTMDMSPSIEYGWGGALTNDGHSQGRTTSSQEDDIPTSNLHMSGASSLDQNTVEPQEGVDLVGLPSGTTIDESTNVAEETHREDVDSEGEEIGNEVEGMSGSDQEKTTKKNPVATDDDQIIYRGTGKTVPKVNHEHNENTISREQRQAENEETDEQTNAENNRSQEKGIDEEEEDKVDAVVEDESQNHLKERKDEDLKEDNSEEPHERGASSNGESPQDDRQEADPDIEVIDGTTIYLSDMLPTPLSDEIRSQITPTPTPGAEHASIPAPILNSQEMDLNPTRSTGHKAPDREQDEKWVVVQNSKNSPNHQHIEDQHSKFLREAQNFMKTRSTENMSPQMGKVVKDLMRKGILEGGSKEETPNQDSKPSGETQDGPHKSDDDNLKDSVAEDDSEIVMPSAPDLDSEKVQNFFKQLMTLPQFSKQPQKALQELNKYIENPSTRVGLTKNEYQIKRLQEKEDKLKKSPEKEKMGEEQTSEDQGDRETGSKSPTEELEESDPEKLLRDGQRSHDDLADGDAYLQAQEEETRREKESHRKKGDEGDANDDVVQDDQRDTYASQAESSQEDVEQFVDPARLLREREEQDDQNVVEVEDGQLEINRDENGENGQDMPKDNQENGDQTERDPPEDMAPANNNILDEIADQIDEILQSNLNGEPDLDVILEQGNTAPSPDDFERGVSSPSEENEPEKEASHQDPLLNIQGDEEMNGLTDEEVPRVDSTSSEHSRSEEMHQEIEELFAGLDAVDAPNREGIPDADKRPDESNEEPPEVSGPPLTEDSYLGEMRRMESTVHTPVEEQGKYENMYDADEKKEVPPSDAGTVSEGEHSETQTQAKDDETTDPYLEEIVESTPTPPVPSHGQVADAKDRQEGDNPSGTGRIFEGGNSEIHSEVAVEVEVEEEADEGIPSRFNRRVPLGLDEGNGFSDQGFLVANDTFGEDHWTMAGINILKPVLVAINTSLQPLMEFLPDDVQLALHGADFLGIPWPVLIVIELISCAVFSFLLCVCFCSCRNPKAFNSSMLDEIEALHGQKADILDTLDMTTMQFKAQNRHYYELKRNGDKNLKERNKLSQSCKELKSKIQTLEKELSLIQSASGQNEKQLTATQQQVDLYEEQVSTASQTIAALQQQVQDLEGSLHDCATTIGVLKQEKQSLSEQNQLLTSTKEQQSEEISGWNERVSEMNEQVELLHNEKKDLEESVTYKDNEIEVLKDCLLQLKGLEADDDEPENDKEAKVHQLMDVTRVSAKLSLVEGEKTELEAKYEAEVRGRRELEAKVGAQQQEVDTAKAGYKTAKSSLDEAQTKLDVMTEYFRNKEVDLQRKLGREEALRLHSDSKLENADEKAATAEVEVTNYRTQIKDLKEELVKAERNYRNQVAAHEKKAHDSWMSVRNAERELQEAKREAATLRHRLTELEGRRAKSEAAPLFKPSPSGREGSPPPTKLGAPSRNSLLADTPSPPRLDQSRALSPGRPMYPGDHPPSPPADNDLAPYRHSTRSGRDSGPPPPFPDDGGPPPHMRRDMDYPPMGRLPPPGRHSHGPPMHDMSYDPHDMRDFSPDGPPPDFGFDPHGPPPPDMDFGPHGPSFNGPPPPLRHPFPPRDFPPHPDDFDHRGPPPDDRDFGPPMDDREFGPPRGYGPPPPGMDFGPMGPPPPLGGPMHGPGPFPNDMGPPPMDRREPPPPLGRSGPSPGPRNPGIRPNIHGQFPPQTGPSPSGNFPPSGPTFGTPTGPQRRTSTPLEGTPVTPQTRPSLRPAQGP